MTVCRDSSDSSEGSDSSDRSDLIMFFTKKKKIFTRLFVQKKKI